jgi:hypothetical protein
LQKCCCRNSSDHANLGAAALFGQDLLGVGENLRGRLVIAVFSSLVVVKDAEDIVAKLRQVDARRSKRQSCAEAVRSIGVSEVTYRRRPRNILQPFPLFTEPFAPDARQPWLLFVWRALRAVIVG